MLRKHFKKWDVSLFYKYFFSNLIILFVPLVLVGTVTFYVSVSKLNQEILLNYENKLEQAAKDLDRQFANMASVALDISNDNSFLPYNLKKSQYHGIEAVQALKRYRSSFFLPQYALLYYKGDEQIYSFDGKYENGIFFDKEIQLPPWETLLEEVDQSEIPFYKPQKSIYFRNMGMMDSFIYVYPISTSHTLQRDAALIYFVTSQAVKNRIQNVLGTFEGNFYLFGPGNEQIMSIENEDGVGSSSILSALRNVSPSEVIKQDGKKYNLFKTISQDTKYTYLLAIPSFSLLNKAEQLKNLMIYILIFSLLGGLLFAWFFAYRSFSPIKKLQAYVRKAFPATAAEHSRNELANIGLALDKTLLSNDSLKARVDGQQLFIQQNLLQSLLKGNWDDHADAAQLRALTMNLEGPFYSVMVVIHSVTDEHLAFKEVLVKIIEDRYSDIGSVYAVDLIHEKHIAVVCGLPENDPDRMKSWTGHLIEICCEHRMEIKIGVGNVYSSLAEVKFSYFEAISALENQQKADSIVFFKDITKNYSDFLWYPSEELLRLLQAVKQGDGEMASMMLTQLNQAMKQQKLSFIMEKLISFDVLNALLRTVYELNLQVSHHDLKTLGTLENTDKLFEQISEMVFKVCDKVSRNRQIKKEQITRNILDYVVQHVLDYDMSLEKLAGKFDLSLYALGKFFKDETGMGFKDYLIKLRMEEAKRLLGESDKNLNEITMDIGYSNVSHFIKTFKKLEGVTPAEFRQMIKTVND